MYRFNGDDCMGRQTGDTCNVDCLEVGWELNAIGAVTYECMPKGFFHIQVRTPAQAPLNCRPKPCDISQIHRCFSGQDVNAPIRCLDQNSDWDSGAIYSTCSNRKTFDSDTLRDARNDGRAAYMKNYTESWHFAVNASGNSTLFTLEQYAALPYLER